MSLWSKCYLVPLEDIRQRVNSSPDVFDESQRRGTRELLASISLLILGRREPYKDLPSLCPG